MEMLIHKVKMDLCLDKQLCVRGKVKCVYDTNGAGDLLPVNFTQNADVITLHNSPAGQVYYRYKKSK